MKKILLIKHDGEMEKIEQKESPTLRQMQEWVGGLVELVFVSPEFGKQMYVNEEGMMKELPINYEASLMSGGQHIVGNAVIFENFEWE